MAEYFELSKSELKAIILGKIQYRKCPDCDADGLEYWDEDGNGVSSFPRPEWGEYYNEGSCQNCDGLGYIQSTLIS